jgi:hypothetical protein
MKMKTIFEQSDLQRQELRKVVKVLLTLFTFPVLLNDGDQNQDEGSQSD